MAWEVPLWLFLSSTVSAYGWPLQRRMNSIGIRSAVHVPRGDRTAFTVIALLCLFLLALMIGYRGRSHRALKWKFAHYLVHIQIFLGVSFVVASSIVVLGLGLTNERTCRAAVYICVVLFTTSKLPLYIVLLERAHIVRAPFLRRRTQDWIWLVGIVVTVLGYGGISIFSYVAPRSSISYKDARCRIGADRVPAVLYLAYDGFIEATMTIIFICLLWPTMKFRKKQHQNRPSLTSLAERESGVEHWRPWFGSNQLNRNPQVCQDLKRMMWRNVIGSTLMTIGSAVNSAVFLSEDALQLGWLCLGGCIADVTWGILIVYWLTLGSSDDSPSARTASGQTESSLSSLPRASTEPDVIEPPKIVLGHFSM